MKLRVLLFEACLLWQSLASSIFETAKEAGSFSTLVSALEKTGLAVTLDSPGRFTVFAPTDSAFAALLVQLGIDASSLLEREDLADILLFHVVSGNFTGEHLQGGMQLQSLQGGQLAVAIDSSVVKIQDATVSTANIFCSNGVIHIIDKVLLPAERFTLAGGNSWNSNQWSVTVDGVMGGRSTGSVTFQDGMMIFSGSINLNGGGFSSVRSSRSVDLTGYAGFWVEVGTTSADRAPLVLALQFEDTSGRDYMAPVALPVATSPIITRSFISISSLTSTNWNGESGSSIQLDPSRIRRMSIYVLYQSGPFEARIKEISAVRSELDAPAMPTIPVVLGLDLNAAVTLLQNTISSGGLVYDKGYPSLCAEMYASAARSLVASASVPATARGVACAGLQFQTASSAIEAWALRRAFDAIMADASAQSRKSESRYISEVQGTWLPEAGEPSAAAAAACSTILIPGPASSDEVASVTAPVMESNADDAALLGSNANDAVLSKNFDGPYVGMGITGHNDFGVVVVNSPEDCAKRCIANSECRSFDYGARSSVTGQCWISKANRASVGNQYEAWPAYDYYEHNARSVDLQANNGLPGMSKQSPALVQEEDSSIPTWIFIALGAAGLMVIILAAVVVTLLLKRKKTRQIVTNSQVVVGKPVTSTSPMGGATCGVVLGA